MVSERVERKTSPGGATRHTPLETQKAAIRRAAAAAKAGAAGPSKPRPAKPPAVAQGDNKAGPSAGPSTVRDEAEELRRLERENAAKGRTLEQIVLLAIFELTNGARAVTLDELRNARPDVRDMLHRSKQCQLNRLERSLPEPYLSRSAVGVYAMTPAGVRAAKALLDA